MGLRFLLLKEFFHSSAHARVLRHVFWPGTKPISGVLKAKVAGEFRLKNLLRPKNNMIIIL